MLVIMKMFGTQQLHQPSVFSSFNGLWGNPNFMVPMKLFSRAERTWTLVPHGLPWPASLLFYVLFSLKKSRKLFWAYLQKYSYCLLWRSTKDCASRQMSQSCCSPYSKYRSVNCLCFYIEGETLLIPGDTPPLPAHSTLSLLQTITQEPQTPTFKDLHTLFLNNSGSFSAPNNNKVLFKYKFYSSILFECVGAGRIERLVWLELVFGTSANCPCIYIHHLIRII